MIKCWNCGFGHLTKAEFHACNTPHRFFAAEEQPGLCKNCGHAEDTEEHKRWDFLEGE